MSAAGTATAPRSAPAGVARPWSVPAWWVVAAYVVLLLAVPSVLIVGPLGAPGTPANLLGVAMLVWWTLATSAGLGRVRGITVVRVTVGLFVASVLLSYGLAAAHGWYSPPHLRAGINDWTLMVPSLPELTATQISAGDRGLIAVASWAGVALVVAEGLRSWGELERIVRVVSWTGGLMAAMGLVQYLTGYDLARLYRIPGLTANFEFGAVAARSVVNRVAATAAHPIEYGVVLATLLPLALHRALYGTGRWRWLPALLMMVGCGLSVSRTTVLGLGVAGLVLWCGWPWRWRLWALVLVPPGLVAMRAAFPGLLGTIYSLFVNVGVDPSVEGRTKDYVTVGVLWEQDPWFGRGFFTLVPQFYRIFDNMYLLVLVELGIVGLVCLAWLFLGAFGTARAVGSRATTARSRHLGLCLSASLASLALAFATFDALTFAMTGGLTFLLVGAVAAAWRLRADDVEEPADPEVSAEVAS